MTSLSVATLLGLLAGGMVWPSVGPDGTRGLDALDRAQRMRAIDRLALQAAASPADAAAVRALLVPVLQDPDANVRTAAARVLVRAGDPQGMAAAVGWVRSPAPTDRPLGLAILRDADTLPPDARAAVDRCVRDADVVVRGLALDVLGRHGPGPSYAAVVAALDDESRDVRLRAIRLLEDARDRRAVVPLLGKLADSDRQVNLDTVRALGALGDPGAAPALLRLVQIAGDDLRLPAIDALGQLRWAPALAVLGPLARRRPTDDAVRRSLLALGQVAGLPPPAGTPAMTLLLDRLREPPIPDEVKEALHRAGPAAVAPLIDLLAQPSGVPASTASAVATLLGASRDRRATLALADLVDRQSPAEPEALRALALLADARALPVLVRAAEIAPAESRRLALEALTALADPRGAAALERGLGDADPEARIAALRLAQRLDARAAGPGIVASLNFPDAAVRRQALAALAAGEAPPGAMAALIAVAVQVDSAGDGEREADVLGDALERVVTAADGATVAAALLQLRGHGRRPLVRALMVAGLQPGAAAPATEVLERLLALAAGDGPLGEAAADALAALAPRADLKRQDGTLIRTFDGASSGVRARLSAALAATEAPAARARLRAVLDDAAETDEVRAAATWAAARLDDPATLAALRRLAQAAAAPVAANARAALARSATGVNAAADGWVGVRLLSPVGGEPLARRWVILNPRGLPPIWVMTGAQGWLHAFTLPAGPISIEPAAPDVSLAATRPARR